MTNAKHGVATSPPILEEVAETLRENKRVRKWLGLSDADIEKFIAHLPTLCVVTAGNVEVGSVVEDDPDDDKFLAAAIESGAPYVVSEDRHLRKLARWHDIEIMSRDEFKAELDRHGVP